MEVDYLAYANSTVGCLNVLDDWGSTSIHTVINAALESSDPFYYKGVNEGSETSIAIVVITEKDQQSAFDINTPVDGSVQIEYESVKDKTINDFVQRALHEKNFMKTFVFKNPKVAMIVSCNKEENARLRNMFVRR